MPARLAALAALAFAAACTHPKSAATQAPDGGTLADGGMAGAPVEKVEDLASAVIAAGVDTPSGLDWDPQTAAKRAGELFKNVQLLGKLTGLRFMAAMQSMEPDLGVRCVHCHVRSDFPSDEKPPKERARVMLKMNAAINDHTFGGEVRVTCYTCHRGEPVPPPLPPPRALPDFEAPVPELREEDKQKPAEAVYQNIKVLKGAPAERVMIAMGFIANALAVRCSHCHVPGRWDSDEKRPKQRAREMFALLGFINKTYYPEAARGVQGAPSASCSMCHRGSPVPARKAEDTGKPPPPQRQ